MPDLVTRLKELRAGLEDFDASAAPAWQAAEIYNSLLTSTKDELPDDPIVQALVPIRPGPPTSSIDAGSMRIAVQQLLTALDPS